MDIKLVKFPIFLNIIPNSGEKFCYWLKLLFQRVNFLYIYRAIKILKYIRLQHRKSRSTASESGTSLVGSLQGIIRYAAYVARFTGDTSAGLRVIHFTVTLCYKGEQRKKRRSLRLVVSAQDPTISASRTRNVE